MNNLFIVGAQRSGTTLLHHMLQRHPFIQMSMPVRPEPKYFLSFDENSRNSSDYIEQLFPSLDSNIRYLGEKSTSYIDHIQALNSINRIFPDSKIILLLRDPLLRAWSNYKFSCENGYESLGFKEALLAEKSRISNPSRTEKVPSVHPNGYLERCNYTKYVQRLYEIFKPHQVQIIVLEELLSDQKVFDNLLIWLGLEPISLSSLSNQKINSTHGPSCPPHEETGVAVACLKPMIERLEVLLGKDLSIWHAREWYQE